MRILCRLVLLYTEEAKKEKREEAEKEAEAEAERENARAAAAVVRVFVTDALFSVQNVPICAGSS
jgi:hypothetical protein